MRTKNILIIFIILAVLGGGWFVFKQKALVSTDHADHKDMYYCPMHPHYTSDRPGNCPICGMKLVKKDSPSAKNSESSSKITGYANVTLPTEKQQLIGIETVAVVNKPLIKTIHAYGYVAHDLELYDAQLEYINAWHEYYAFQSRRPVKDEFRADWRDYYKKEPSQNRWRSHDKVQGQQRLVKAEYELRHMGLTDGDLAKLREIKYGQPWVQPDLLFFEDNQPFWIYAEVPESDLGYLAAGQKVIANIPTYKEKTEGTVRSVSSFVDPATRTTRVRIEMPKYIGELGVNMFVNVEIPVELDTSLLIPRDAVMDTGARKVVFVQTKDGVFEPREITTGMEGDGMIAVKSGLKAGERIVAAGNFLLDSESRLQSARDGVK